MKSLIFIKRNFKEMLRDPLLYIFCAGFPIALIGMFQIILHYTNGKTPIFEVKSLIPGVMMFSYTLLMLMCSLLISKDKSTQFIKRLYTSPMRSHNYLIGYFVPYFLVGIIQSFICIIMGYIFGAINGSGFIDFGKALLLILEMIPIMCINIFVGMILGRLLNDKSAPAITSIFISCSGVLGGAWMPLDTMGGFETFTMAFPFHPAVYLGRVITGAKHTTGDSIFTFDDKGVICLVIVLVYLVISLALSILFFNKKFNK